MTLTEFLLARIAEDKAGADAMGHRTDPEGEDGYYACPATRDYPLGDLPYGEEHCDCGLAEHKRRALAECEAKRRIVEEVARYDGESYDGNSGALNSLDAILATLAAVYADHPDYQAEWAA